MLFISRLVGSSSYGVVDTDDGVEEVVNYDYLSDALDAGLEIKGIKSSVWKVTGSSPSVDYVEPYQNPATVTALQTKTKVLKGIDVVVYDDTVVAIIRDDKSCPDGTALRISDFASKCGDSIFLNTRNNTNRLVVVFDDKVKIIDRTFRFAPSANVTIDVREVTKADTIRLLYEEHITRGGFARLDDLILDNPVRQDYWRGMECIRIGRDPLAGYFLPETRVAIAKMMLWQFQHIADYDYKSVKSIKHTSTVDQHIGSIGSDYNFWRFNTETVGYDEVRKYDTGLFSCLGELGIFDLDLVRNCQNYLFFFIPVEQIQELYKKFAFRFCNWLLDFNDGEV